MGERGLASRMLDVAVLGAVEAQHGGRELALGGPKQRALLAYLCMSGPALAPSSTLIDALWEVPPDDPVHALQAHVSRLRAALPVSLERHDGGYRLAPGTYDVDAARFTRGCQQGRELLAAHRYDEASTQLSHA